MLYKVIVRQKGYDAREVWYISAHSFLSAARKATRKIESKQYNHRWFIMSMESFAKLEKS